MSRTPYDLLGVSEDAISEEIRKAQRRFAKQFHPDCFDGTVRKENEARLTAINAAATELLDPERRRRLDARLALTRRLALDIRQTLLERLKQERAERAEAARRADAARQAFKQARAKGAGLFQCIALSLTEGRSPDDLRSLGLLLAGTGADALWAMRRRPR
jgi:curved DNA-binding protein CbpA